MICPICRGKAPAMPEDQDTYEPCETCGGSGEMNAFQCPDCGEAACVCTVVHELKCWPMYFQALHDGTKTFEIRKNDRDYKVGEVLKIREFEPCEKCKGTRREWDDGDRTECTQCFDKDLGECTGGTYVENSPELFFKITYITSFDQMGGHIVMGLDQLKPSSRLIAHAIHELNLVGFSKDCGEEEGDWMRKCVLQLIKTFALQGHSGGTAPYCLAMFEKLSNQRPLSPLTGEDHEWEDVSQYGDPSVKWQNKRCSSVLKGPDGIAFDTMARMLVLPDGQVARDAEAGSMPISFPYTPETEFIDLEAYEASQALRNTLEEGGPIPTDPEEALKCLGTFNESLGESGLLDPSKEMEEDLTPLPEEEVVALKEAYQKFITEHGKAAIVPTPDLLMGGVITHRPEVTLWRNPRGEMVLKGLDLKK